MYRRIALFSVAVLISLGAFAQARIGFTNLNGFPSVIVNGTGYNLSGYVHNTGTDTLFTGIDVMMSVNSGPSIPIQNNWVLPSPLAPGDSVLWTKGGHNFPPGQFAPGNNDVLIWPTRMQGPGSQSESDTLDKNIFFATSAAFALTGSIEGVYGEIPFRDPVTLAVEAQNVGKKANRKQLELTMAFNASQLKVLAEDYDRYEVGENVIFVLHEFVLEDYLDDMGISPFDAIGGVMTFWVAEKDGMEPVNTISYPIASFATGIEENLSPEMGVFPNPAGPELNLRVDDAASDGIEKVRLYGMNGQLLREFDGMVKKISLQGLAAGRYFIEIQKESGSYTYPFIKK